MPGLGKEANVRAIALGTLIGAAAVTWTTGCATTTTRLGTVSPDAVAQEQEKQREFAVRSQLEQQARVDDVGDALLRAAVPLCGGNVVSRLGVSAGTVSLFKTEWQPAARAVGLSDTVTILHVSNGSGADRAGLHAGDRILALDGRGLAFGKQGLTDMQERVSMLVRAQPVVITYWRDSATATDSVTPDLSCAYDVREITSNVLNAWADGKTITVTSAMLRFVPDDDELATVLAHEIAHDAMHHIRAKKRNSVLGALFGAAADIAAAAGGYNTNGAFTRSGAEAGAEVFSQDFEREADYVGLYIMALSGRSIDRAPDLWRRMAAESPGSIKFASSHPTTAERFVRLEQWIAEIHRKQASGEPLRPEMKK